MLCKLTLSVKLTTVADLILTGRLIFAVTAFPANSCRRIIKILFSCGSSGVEARALTMSSSAALSAGAYTMSENHLYTKEAIRAFLSIEAAGWKGRRGTALARGGVGPGAGPAGRTPRPQAGLGPRLGEPRRPPRRNRPPPVGVGLLPRGPLPPLPGRGPPLALHGTHRTPLRVPRLDLGVPVP